MARLVTRPSVIIMRADGLAEFGLLADHLGDDVARAFEGLVGGHAELGGEFGESGRGGRICSQRKRASGSSPLSRAIDALVRRFGL